MWYLLVVKQHVVVAIAHCISSIGIPIGFCLMYRTGFKVSLGFFEDIHVPDYALPDPSFFSEEEQVWFWRFDNEQMFLDPGEDIRLRVKEVRFEPEPKRGQKASQPDSVEEIETAPQAAPHAPMRLIGSIAEEGCGATAWWEQPEDMAEAK